MKKLLTKSAVLAAGALMSLTAIQATAAGLTTQCHYNLINGAPWAPKTKVEYYSGHITCPQYAHEAIGGYVLSRQYHL